MDLGIFQIYFNKYIKLKKKIFSYFKSPIESNTINYHPEVDLSDVFANKSSEFFPWCGYDFDVRKLDIYFNYDKYFESQDSLNKRFNSTNNYRNAIVSYNLRFLRLFTMNLTPLVLDTRINSVPAVLGNLLDMFALSAVRFLVMSKQMPQQV